MEDQYFAGRTKSIGVSNFSIKKIERILKKCRVAPANNQVEMHIYLQQKNLVDFCTQNGITVVAYAPLGTRGYNEFMTKHGHQPKKLPDFLTNRTVVAIAKKHSKTPAQVLIRFLLQLGVSTIPKSVTPSRIRENFDVFDFELDENDMTALRALDAGSAGRICDFKAFGRLVSFLTEIGICGITCFFLQDYRASKLFILILLFLYCICEDLYLNVNRMLIEINY